MSGANKVMSADMSSFREVFKKAKHIAVLTGAGISAESGIPTFRGSGGFWRTYRSQDLAAPGAFKSNPSLVWEFYHYRRELVLTKSPNKAHEALAACEEHLKSQGKNFTLITQNIDGLHQSAGSKNVIELHGSLFKTRCTKCRHVEENRDSPICPALAGKGAPDAEDSQSRIPANELPQCKQQDCAGLLRPHVVWFGENLDSNILRRAESALDSCDLCLVIGTSSVVYPAAMFAPKVAERGVPVAEFNLEDTPATRFFTVDPRPNYLLALKSRFDVSDESRLYFRAKKWVGGGGEWIRTSDKKKVRLRMNRNFGQEKSCELMTETLICR